MARAGHDKRRLGRALRTRRDRLRAQPQLGSACGLLHRRPRCAAELARRGACQPPQRRRGHDPAAHHWFTGQGALRRISRPGQPPGALHRRRLLAPIRTRRGELRPHRHANRGVGDGRDPASPARTRQAGDRTRRQRLDRARRTLPAARWQAPSSRFPPTASGTSGAPTTARCCTPSITTVRVSRTRKRTPDALSFSGGDRRIPAMIGERVMAWRCPVCGSVDDLVERAHSLLAEGGTLPRGAAAPAADQNSAARLTRR